MDASELHSEWRSRLPGLDRLWALTRGNEAVRVAVLDGPVASGLVSRDSAPPSGALEHGTLVRSILAGSADGAVPGLAPDCVTAAFPIFEQPEDGRPIVCSQDVLAEAIGKALAFGALILNISASQLADTLALSSRLSAALQEAAERDVLIVAAAGNHGCACETIPASVSGVLAVGAHDQEGAPLRFSNWGMGVRAEGILAPGVGIPGACVAGGVCRATGTSFATAIVSGVSALLMSLDLAQDRVPSGRRIKQLLLQSSDPCRPEEQEVCSVFLRGQLNVSRALTLVLGSSDRISRGEDMVTMGQTGSALASHALQEEVRFTGGEPASLQAADCGCGCGGKCGAECNCGNAGGVATNASAQGHRTQLVYAIGRLGISFPSQTRRDSLWRSIHGSDARKKPEIDLKPLDNASLRGLLEREPWQAQSVIWTLSRSEVPMFAIVPSGAFAAETYELLVREWSDDDVEFISLPGVVAGQVRL